MKTHLRKALTLLLCMFLLVPVLAACTDTQTAGPTASGRPSATPTAGGTGSSNVFGGTLRIAALDSAGLKDLVTGFRTLHPDTEVILDCAFGPDDPEMDDAERAERRDAFASRILLDMQNGEGPDLMDVSGLSFYDLFAQGLFDDLYTHMDSDPAFLREDYFENIFTALEYHEGLYAFPTAVAMPFVHVNSDILRNMGLDDAELNALSEKETISSTQILELYRVALDAGAAGGTLRLEDADRGTSLLWEELACYLDAKSGTARFDSPEFVAYLNTQRPLIESAVFNPPSSMEITPKPPLLRYNTLISTGYFKMPALLSLIDILSADERNAFPYSLVLGESEEDRPFMAHHLLSIAENSENKELAWAFITYCVAESPSVSYNQSAGLWHGDRFDAWVPVNRNSLKKYANAIGKDLVDGPVDNFTPKSCAALESWVESLGRGPLFFDLTLFDDILAEYCNEIIDAEECANQMQELAEEYFASMSPGE